MAERVRLLQPPLTFFYNGAWRQIGRPVTENHNDDLLVPNSCFVIRNPASVASATTLPLTGNLQTGIQLVPLTAQSDSWQGLVSVSRPTDVKLNDLGLIASGAFVPSASASQLKDQLLVFDNTQTGLNKSASAAYFQYNGAWRKVGQPVTSDFGSDVIPSGSGVLIRKSPSGGTAKVLENAPNNLSETSNKAVGS